MSPALYCVVYNPPILASKGENYSGNGTARHRVGCDGHSWAVFPIELRKFAWLRRHGFSDLAGYF